MKWLLLAVTGAICLGLVDKWAGLGFIWPETSQKGQIRPRTGPDRPVRVSAKADPNAVIASLNSYRKMWNGERW